MLSVSLWTTQHPFTVTREEKGGKYYYYWRRSRKCFCNVSYSNSTGRKRNTTLIAKYISNTENTKYIIKRTITNRCDNIFWQATFYQRLKYFFLAACWGWAWLSCLLCFNGEYFLHQKKHFGKTPHATTNCRSARYLSLLFMFPRGCDRSLFASTVPSYLIVGFPCFHAVFQVSDQGVDQTWMFPHRLSVALLCAA